MNTTQLKKLLKIFGLPLLYISISSYLAALLVTVLKFTDGPVYPWDILGLITGFYIVWFIAEGRTKLKEFKANKG